MGGESAFEVIVKPADILGVRRLVFGEVDAIDVVVPERDDVGAVDFFECRESSVDNRHILAIDKNIDVGVQFLSWCSPSQDFRYPLQVMILIEKPISLKGHMKITIGGKGSRDVIVSK